MKLPLCKDCIHRIEVEEPDPVYRNQMGIVVKCTYFIDAVTGEVYTRSCYEARGAAGPCGFEGRLFEEKPQIKAAYEAEKARIRSQGLPAQISGWEMQIIEPEDKV